MLFAQERAARIWFVAGLLTTVSMTSFGATASLQVTARSLNLRPASFTSPVPGVGQVTAYFNTYSPPRDPLIQYSGQFIIVSGELRPRTSTTYETDYAILQVSTLTEYGSALLNLPSTDSNSNGLPDFMEYDRAISVPISGSFSSDWPAFSQGTVSGTLTRPANSATGTYTLTLSTGGRSSRLNAELNLIASVPADSSITYQRGATNTAELKFRLVSAGGASATVSANTAFTVPDADTVVLAPFSFVDSSSMSFSVGQTRLNRNGKRYTGLAALADGMPATHWPDYREWHIEVVDQNDTDKDGIPDLSDAVPPVPPAITSDPTDKRVAPGQAVEFSVTATGTGLTYQWYKDGVAIAGATSSKYTIAAAKATDAGKYRVVVTNPSGTATSRDAALDLITVIPTVTNSTQPHDVPVGGSVTLRGTVANSTVTQWLVQGKPVGGANAVPSTLSNVQPYQSGYYTLLAANGGASVRSKPVLVRVGTPDLLLHNETLDRTRWAVALPFSDSNATAAGAGIVLENRGRLLSHEPYPTLVDFRARIRFTGSTYDNFNVVLRTDGTTQSGSFSRGIAAKVQLRGGDAGSLGVNNVGFVDMSGIELAAGSIALATNTWFDLRVVDDGYTLGLYLDDMANPVVTTSTITRTGHLIGIQNREGAGGGSFISAGSRVEIDHIQIYSLGAHHASGVSPRFVNVSTRGFVGTGSQSMIAGLVVSGNTARRMVIRAAGPALAPYGVQGVLGDPFLNIYAGEKLIGTNDDWNGNVDAGFAFARGSKDSAVEVLMPPGGYTAQVIGTGDRTGVALVEVYDLEEAHGKGDRVANLSTRGLVRAGDQIMIAGIVTSGAGMQTLLIRGVGPTLQQYGVTDALPDPVLRIYDEAGTLLLSNDDWGTYYGDVVGASFATAGAFALPQGSADAAFVVQLPPGRYTFQLSSADNRTGVALLEAYELRPD